MFQLHIFVSGFVQGVGFRRFLRSKARGLDLTGWVKNIPNGRVEAVVVGPKAALEEFIKIIKKGNWISGVKDLSVDWEDAKSEFSDFEIIR